MSLRGQKAGTDALGKNLEERNEVFKDFEVRGDLQPAAEALSLAPVGGVLLEDGIGETLGDRFLFSILVIFRLHMDGRGADVKSCSVGSVHGSGREIAFPEGE